MPGLCERRGGVHSGGRSAHMCAFSRPLACEYQVLSGPPARMLKKKTGFDRFFLYRLSPEPRPSAPECERLNVGNNARVVRSPCVFRAFWWRGVRSIVRFNVNICHHFAPLSLLPRCFPVIKRCSSRQNVGRCVRVGRCAAHGFITALQLIAKRIAFVSYVSIYQHTRD